MKSILALLIVSAPVIAMEQPKQQVKLEQPAKVIGFVVTPRMAIETTAMCAILPAPVGIVYIASKVAIAVVLNEMARRDNQ
jgi:hypothetical protein